MRVHLDTALQQLHKVNLMRLQVSKQRRKAKMFPSIHIFLSKSNGNQVISYSPSISALCMILLLHRSINEVDLQKNKILMHNYVVSFIEMCAEVLSCHVDKYKSMHRHNADPFYSVGIQSRTCEKRENCFNFLLVSNLHSEPLRHSTISRQIFTARAYHTDSQ